MKLREIAFARSGDKNDTSNVGVIPYDRHTAAGDAFTGALAVAWGEGRDLVEAVRWANAAGAACVRKLGASNALPSREEIDAVAKG